MNAQPANPHVLIVSTALDLATDAVVRVLAQRGVRATRWNTEDYPFESQLTADISPHGVSPSCGWERSPADPMDLRDVTAVWYRRIRIPPRPMGMDVGVYDFCLRESRAAILGTLLGALPTSAKWMSPPTAMWAAEHKVFQLTMARQVGLEIPDTVVTNSAKQVRRAFDRFGGHMIAKPVRTGYVEVQGEPYAIFTSSVSAEDLIDATGADLSPVIYQPFIKKRCDVRVTIVGDSLFVAEIDSQGNAAARVDWRRTDDPHLPHRRTTLPDAIAASIRQLMAQLGLTFGALDFIATPDGRFVFLEVNPNGQWLWLDDQLDFGISASVADWLATYPGDSTRR